MKPILRSLIIAAALAPTALAHPGHGEPMIDHDHAGTIIDHLTTLQSVILVTAIIAVAFAVSKLVTHLKARRAARKP
jgi:hypothetical protein